MTDRPPPDAKAEAKQRRLAEALRANLRRRKAGPRPTATATARPTDRAPATPAEREA